MKRIIPIVLLALLLPGCANLKAAYTAVTAPISTTDAQKTYAGLETARLAELKIAIAYTSQPACGLPASPPAPLCASYSFALQWQKADAAFADAMLALKNTLADSGSSATAVQLAINGAQNALTALQSITASYGAKK